MSPTPIELAAAAGVELVGAAAWGTRIRDDRPGLYIVSINRDPAATAGLSEAPIDVAAVQRWITRVPQIRLHGEPVTAAQLAAHLARWWLPGTPVLYLGKATNIRNRVHQLVKTPLGANGPHPGGAWLKTLSIASAVTVHYAVTADAAAAARAEDDALAAFMAAVQVPAGHPEPGLPLPWANLSVDRPLPRRRRDHGVAPTTV